MLFILSSGLAFALVFCIPPESQGILVTMFSAFLRLFVSFIVFRIRQNPQKQRKSIRKSYIIFPPSAAAL
jgi:hypothetical protein